ncbi:MAG: hypothetical protein ABSA52_21770 [Candidatus Binatia bacterium]|jgi:hypothetical protein
MTTNQPTPTAPAPSYLLHCRTCGAGFFGMLEKLAHQERCGQPARPPAKRRKKDRTRP